MLSYGKPSLRQIPVLWLVLSGSGQDFAVRTVSVETVQPVYFCFGAKPANSKQRKKTEYCHSSHWNYQKKLKRLKFFRNFKDGWRRRTFWSASHRKCILLSETECHIINNLLTELARAVPGNIGPRSFSYGPRCARSLSRRNARVSCNQEKLRHPERALDLKTKDSLVLTKPFCSLANHNPELRCVICTVLHFLLGISGITHFYTRVTHFALLSQPIKIE